MVQRGRGGQIVLGPLLERRERVGYVCGCDVLRRGLLNLLVDNSFNAQLTGGLVLICGRGFFCILFERCKRVLSGGLVRRRFLSVVVFTRHIVPVEVFLGSGRGFVLLGFHVVCDVKCR